MDRSRGDRTFGRCRVSRRGRPNAQSIIRERSVALYLTDCPLYGDKAVPVKYFLWVKTRRCDNCDHEFDLFPGYLIATDARHPKNVLICANCGELNEVGNLADPGQCFACQRQLVVEGPAKRGPLRLPEVRKQQPLPRCGRGGTGGTVCLPSNTTTRSEKAGTLGGFSKGQTPRTWRRSSSADERFGSLRPEFVPPDEIPAGDETDRLHRWGYHHYRELFNNRQLLGLELSCREIANMHDVRIRTHWPRIFPICCDTKTCCVDMIRPR